MGFNSKITPEERLQIFEWAKEGVKYAEMARRLDNRVSKQRLQQLCRKNGFDSAATRKAVMLEAHEKKRQEKLGSFYKESDDEVDWKTWERVYKRFKEKSNASSWEFDLEFSYVEFHKHCPILGVELDYHNSGKENSAEFDRIDSTRGYVKGNVWVISRRANRIKNDGTAEEHRLICNAMFRRGAM